MHAAHLTGDVHVPHLVAVAGPSASLLLSAVFLHVGAVVHAVPHPQPHILGDEQGLVGNGFVVHVGGYVDEACQLLVDGVVRCPHPVGVVVRTVHLYQRAVLGGYGVEVAVAVPLRVLLVFVKGRPRAFHVFQLLLRGEVARLPVAAERVVPHEGLLLTGTQFVDHACDIGFEYRLLLRVLGHGISLGDGRHVMAGAMALELGVGRVPSVGSGVARCGHVVGVAVVVELLGHVPGAYLLERLVAVVAEPVVAVDGHRRQGKRHGLLTDGGWLRLTDHPDDSLYGVAIVGGVVTDHIAFEPVAHAGGMAAGIGFVLLARQRSIHPPYLPVFGTAVTIGHPQAVRQTGRRADGALHAHRLHLPDGSRSRQ